ncbi:hypothetical protein HUU62_27115, partial [Rhodoferax sp. 4810]|nr:hypothetical protein [Rhodoferax jenense]
MNALRSATLWGYKECEGGKPLPDVEEKATMTTGIPMVLLVDDDEFHLDMIHAQLLSIG